MADSSAEEEGEVEVNKGGGGHLGAEGNAQVWPGDAVPAVEGPLLLEQQEVEEETSFLEIRP
jgi:hypothetical protein